MPIPDISELENVAKSIVWDAKKAGSLDTLTPRIIRKEIESRLSLVSGTLDAEKFKNPLKLAVKAAVEDEVNVTAPTEEIARKKMKRKSEETEAPQTKKPKFTPKSKPKPNGDTSEQSKKKKKDFKEHKSSVAVLSTDTEEENDLRKAIEQSFAVDISPPPQSRPRTNSTKEAQGKINSSPGKRRKLAATSDLKEEVQKHNSQPERVPDIPDSSPSTSKLEADQNQYKSESELSILIDDPPKRNKKSKNKDKGPVKAKKPVNEKKPKNPPVESSKDEETIKRLKALVVACGVRKVWSKVFQDIDRPSQQIKRLKEILSELGMTGRLSLEQAKAIKQKRELAQELEDVQSFEKSVVAGPSSRTRTKRKPQNAESSSEDEERSESEDEVPSKRKSAARLSIMAFLEDQSDDE